MAERDDAKDGVKIDVGVKAEVPSQSAGRTIDALTDLIRPISEWTGLRGDRLRLQRQETLLEIAKRTHEIRAIENAPLEPVSTKFLVPFLEIASREEPDDELIEWWAKLLASASTATDNQQPVFTTILGSMTTSQAQLASKLWGYINDWQANFSETGRVALEVRGQLKHVGDIAYQAYKRETGRGENNDAVRSAFAKAFQENATHAVDELERCGLYIEFLELPGDASLHKHRDGANGDIDALVALGVLKRTEMSVRIPTPYIGQQRSQASVIHFSALGARLMEICHRTL